MKKLIQQPLYTLAAFNCPHCGVYSRHIWGYRVSAYLPEEQSLYSLSVAICDHCEMYSLWDQDREMMIYPISGDFPLPNEDLPEEIKTDFVEAREIANISPRGAAALLRLCIQKLCIHLGEPGKDLNADIGALVKKGLNPSIRKSLDIVRVIGNESVHPGTIDLRDDPLTTSRLFMLVNIITDALITQPKLIEETYGNLPEAKKVGIERRDNPTN